MKAHSVRLPFKKGRLLWLPEDIGEAVRPGNMFFNGWLTARRFNVERIDDFDLGSGLVTDAGVAYMVDDFDNAAGGADISNFNYHDAGTGTTAAAVGDTALVTAWGGARVTGTRSQPTASQYRSVGTITFNNTFAITEWGFFSASSGPTLWDRRVFTAINVVNNDSIEFTYTLTVNSGG